LPVTSLLRSRSFSNAAQQEDEEQAPTAPSRSLATSVSCFARTAFHVPVDVQFVLICRRFFFCESKQANKQTSTRGFQPLGFGLLALVWGTLACRRRFGGDIACCE
jgi:hypothetical protein